MTDTILILGAHGRFGSHAARAFTEAGWHVRTFDRSNDDLNTALRGADVVLNAANPPGYNFWDDTLVESHAKVAKAARHAGATVILPGNVYVFGPDAPMPWRSDTPHLATNRLALIRKRIEAGYRESGARTIILRCGDYIDREPTGNWFESYIANTAHKGFIRYPGDPSVPHAWAYLPDAARAAVALAEIRDRLSGFEDVPFEGYTLSGNEMAEEIGRALQRDISVKPFQWGMMRLIKPFMPVLNGVFEMRYLWSLPQRLDGARLAELVPEFTPSPVHDALSAALAYQSAPEKRAA